MPRNCSKVPASCVDTKELELEHDNTENNVNDDGQITLSQSLTRDENVCECYPLMEDSIKVEEQEILLDEGVIRVKEEQMEVLERLDSFELTNHVAVLEENELGAYYNYEIHCKSEIDSEFVECAVKEDPDGVIFFRSSSINSEPSTSSTHILIEQHDSPSLLLDDKFVSNNCKSNREDLKNQLKVHNTDSTKVKWYRCNSCDHQTKRKYSLKAHMLVHKDPSQLTWYECNSCSYKAKQKSWLKIHMLAHKDPSQLKWFECNSCDYKTKHKYSLKRHMFIHKDPSEVTWYECDLCSFKTKRKWSLKVHTFVHKNNSDITWYKCDLCDYKSLRKDRLERHVVVHTDAPKISRWFKCDLCDYKSAWNSSLKYHMLSHKNSSEIKWYQCDLCDYKAKRRYVLRNHVESVHKKIRNAKRLKEYKCDVCDYKTTGKSAIRNHMVIHKDPSDIDWYNCDSCDYKAKWKSCLRSHVLTHKDRSTLRLFKCDLCDYKAKWKSYLKVHVLIHKDDSEIKWNKCDVCDFKTKWKPNLKAHNKSFHHKITPTVEDFIIPFVNTEEGNRIDLKQIYLNEKGSQELIDALRDRNLCRLCMNVVDDDVVYLDGSYSDMMYVKEMIKRCIPEVNINNTRNAVVCKVCISCLKNYRDFMDGCLQTEKKIEHYCRENDIDQNGRITLAEVLEYNNRGICEVENINSDCSSLKLSVKREVPGNPAHNVDFHNKIVEADGGSDSVCGLSSAHPSDLKWYNCDSCNYKSSKKGRLKKHMLIHKDLLEVNLFKCEPEPSMYWELKEEEIL
ncbi:hypothetical protein NQ315_015553 [Exocentrus adspersus]|uniref:Uncharacterized protein n=1 Tax=Exocentrus adspersus TaxID=1586481 RepID=A0AAV8V630_9CUCU|nr:hypothetical protein NQ315_015553 [Exocentrus adspersus]